MNNMERTFNLFIKKKKLKCVSQMHMKHANYTGYINLIIFI